MTNIQIRKNEYDHEVADCPFCDKWVYVRPTTKVSPDPLRDLKRHITNQAKNEAMEKYLRPEASIDHLMYYVAHTKPKVVPKPNMRMYDADLTIQK